MVEGVKIIKKRYKRSFAWPLRINSFLFDSSSFDRWTIRVPVPVRTIDDHIQQLKGPGYWKTEHVDRKCENNTSWRRILHQLQ